MMPATMARSPPDREWEEGMETESWEWTSTPPGKGGTATSRTQRARLPANSGMNRCHEHDLFELSHRAPKAIPISRRLDSGPGIGMDRPRMDPELEAAARAAGVGRGEKHIFLCADASKPKCCDRAQGLVSWEFLKKRLAEL